MQIHNAVITGSFSYNGADLSNVTSSNAYSASLSSRTTNLESTSSVLVGASSSFSSILTSVSSSQQQISSSLLNVIAIGATTGSNSFRANQSITGSLTVTAQIIAQSLNVQQVTSSIVYSSGSNVFGCDINSRQTFTGSFYQTGSISVFNSCVAIGTNSSPQQILSVNNPFTSNSTLYPIVISQQSTNEIGGMYSVADAVTNPIGAGLAWKIYKQNVGLVEGMRMTSGGNVGIGTTSPFNFGTGHRTLDVRGDGVSNIGALFVGNCDRSSVLGVYINPAAGGIVGTSSNHYLGLVTCDVERIKITSNGFVGVNCNDPKYILDVNGLVNINAVATTNQGTVQSLRISSNSGNAAVTINGNAANSYAYLTFAQNCVGKFEIGVSSCTDPTSPSSLYINPNIQLGACNSAIYVKSNGNVGVGSSCTTSKLSVAGTISFTADYDATSAMSIFRENGNKLTIGGGTSGIQLNKADMSLANASFFDNGMACFRNLVCAQGGVKFANGTGTLNYYETGTWTPRISNGSWTSSASGGNAGWYTRIGNVVTVGGTIQWTAGSGAQGQDLRIVCLPFVSSTSANERNVGQIGAPGGDSIAYTCSTKGQFVIVNDPNQASMYVIETYQSGTWATYIHGPTVNSAGVIYGFQLTYHI